MTMLRSSINQYLSYLRSDRGARIAFLVCGLSWLAVFGMYHLIELCQIMFPTMLPHLFQAITLGLQQIMDVLSSIFSWYPRLKHALGLNTHPDSFQTFFQRRITDRAELMVALVTMGLFTILCGIIGTVIYETGKRIYRRKEKF